MSLLNMSGVKESGFMPLPEGTYPVVVDDASVKDTKSGNGGQYIAVKLRIINDEQWEGKFIFTQFNIKNPNPKAVEIGLGQLKSFLRIAGHKDPNVLEDVLDIVGYKANAVVKIDADKNYVSYFKPYEVKETKSSDLPF